MFEFGVITDLQTAKRIAKKLFQTYNNSSAEGIFIKHQGNMQSNGM